MQTTLIIYKMLKNNQEINNNENLMNIESLEIVDNIILHYRSNAFAAVPAASSIPHREKQLMLYITYQPFILLIVSLN